MTKGNASHWWHQDCLWCPFIRSLSDSWRNGWGGRLCQDAKVGPGKSLRHPSSLSTGILEGSVLRPSWLACLNSYSWVLPVHQSSHRSWWGPGICIFIKFSRQFLHTNFWGGEESHKLEKLKTSFPNLRSWNQIPSTQAQAKHGGVGWNPNSGWGGGQTEPSSTDGLLTS